MNLLNLITLSCNQEYFISFVIRLTQKKDPEACKIPFGKEHQM